MRPAIYVSSIGASLLTLWGRRGPAIGQYLYLLQTYAQSRNGEGGRQCARTGSPLAEFGASSKLNGESEFIATLREELAGMLRANS